MTWLFRLPEAPVMVTGKVPTPAPTVTDTVKRLVVVAGFVPKAALTPLGRPDAVKPTGLLNPFRGLIVMVVELPLPWTTVKLVDNAEREKPGCDDTGQLFTKLAALMVPIPVAKSQPMLVP